MSDVILDWKGPDSRPIIFDSSRLRSLIDYLGFASDPARVSEDDVPVPVAVRDNVTALLRTVPSEALNSVQIVAGPKGSVGALWRNATTLIYLDYLRDGRARVFIRQDGAEDQKLFSQTADVESLSPMIDEALSSFVSAASTMRDLLLTEAVPPRSVALPELQPA